MRGTGTQANHFQSAQNRHGTSVDEDRGKKNRFSRRSSKKYQTDNSSNSNNNNNDTASTMIEEIRRRSKSADPPREGRRFGRKSSKNQGQAKEYNWNSKSVQEYNWNDPRAFKARGAEVSYAL